MTPGQAKQLAEWTALSADIEFTGEFLIRRDNPPELVEDVLLSAIALVILFRRGQGRVTDDRSQAANTMLEHLRYAIHAPL